MSAFLGAHKKISRVGTWSEGGMDIHTKNVYERRRNLTGVTLITSVNSWSPVSILKEDDNSEIHQSGRNIKMFIELTVLTQCSPNLGLFGEQLVQLQQVNINRH